ncbi:MAG TPA: bifunctional (p)ppGpp synthetase/guanosine-3',5'-bis(diphosphate) 3'-pyrophosphohydrolase [Chloroflexi bacterium]|nr:bifunctional (p)ppGpp synthetase/guanosine-3',5'-bis(diphosphate) 3'-pyrophosphohydrolase [Chloroflexota bacterium]
MLLEKYEILPLTIEELVSYYEQDNSPIQYAEDEMKGIWLAYEFAKKAHDKQLRLSGDPFLSHPLAVSKILVSLGMDVESIMASLLHDVVEDTEVTLADISSGFGDQIARIVDGVTTLKQYESPGSNDAESIKKLFLAIVDDPRVIVVKLADRLHNLRTIAPLPRDRQVKTAKETLEIYAPIAERMGIWSIKGELEDLAFKCLEPEIYQQILYEMEKSREEHRAILNDLIEKVKKIMVESNLDPSTFQVTGRRKYIYSIYNKMQKPKYQGKGLDAIYDKLGIRIIVPSIPDCYAVLGLIHATWSPIPGEFDDYIGMKLPSGYQSLHTSVKYGPDKNDIVEFQIRTLDMHNEAEFGVAAHWIYKDSHSGKRDIAMENKIKWLRLMLEEPQEEDSNAEEDPETFLSMLKSDLLQERIYVFTPQGDIKDLPNGATPIDFAYAVHTSVGHRCRGAKVNGRLVSLEHRLQTGDQVQILTAKQGGPSRDWLNPSLGLVNTARARSKIRHWFKNQAREQNLTQGQAILEKELQKLGLEHCELSILLKTLDFKTIEDIYIAIGCGDLSLQRVINLLSEYYRDEDDPLLMAIHPAEKQEDKNAVSILGLRDLLTSFSSCCAPAPGDEILGYITRGRGVTIHRADCPNILRLQESERERIIKVAWGEPQKTYPVSILIRAYDRQGLIGDVSNVLRDENVNIIDVNVRPGHNIATIQLTLEVSDIAKLSKILTRIEALPNVIETHRIKPG